MTLVARIKEKNGGVTVMVLINKLHLVSPQLSLLTIFFLVRSTSKTARIKLHRLHIVKNVNN